MDDFPGLAKDFGIKPQGKSAPMAPPKSSSSGSSYEFGSDFTRSSYGNAKSTFNSIFDDQDREGILFNDAYGGQRKYSDSRAASAQTSSFDYDSFFKDTKPPVFDKPVYDDDIFDGLPGIKSSSAKLAAKYDDVFEVSGSPRKHKSMNSLPFDDLLGNPGRKETEVKANSERLRAEKDAPLFDDLFAGFSQSSSAASARSTSEAGQYQRPPSNSSKTASNLMGDAFGVFEPTHDSADSSTGLFTDPYVMSKPNGFGKSKVENSSGTGVIFDDIDPLDGFGQSVPPVSSEINKRGKDRSPLRTASEPQDRDHENGTKKRMPSMDGFLDSNQPVFDMPSMSTDFHSSVGRTTSPPPYSNVGSNETSSQVHTTPRSEDNFDASDDVWLTVSEVPLFTQPTRASPPSRPPPPRPPRVSKTTTGSFSSKNAKKKVDDFSTFQNSTQYSQSSQSARAEASISVTSQIDELEDFAMGRAWNNVDRAEVFPGDGFETNSAAAAAASAAAMKEAMDRAEAKFRHAKEMRERENLRAARTKEAGQMDKDERATQDALDREVREKKERLEHERQQREREEEEREKMRREMEREREEKEREQKRFEKERDRVREMERERARQAVERATREARERAAAEARARAERASVAKATAEARARAERAAVQRAQAEARERAAAEAKERAERASAEAREREAREREARERTAAAKAEADAKHRAERAAVERAAAEARDRAAAEARERAAASARASQQYNDNDLESFFSMGSRPSSAPRPRADASDPVFDGKNKGGPEVTRRTSVGSSSMKKASSTANIVDLTSLFGAAPSTSGDFQEVEGETEERRRARLERHQRTQERAAKALAEKNQRDLQVQREQAERHRIAETLDVEIKRWASGKEGNMRALLSTLQYVLWPECGWQPVSLTDLITAAAVKKAYRKATLCIHPDKVQQKGANLQQKYVSEKVFDLLKEAWNKFNSEELF